MSGDLQDGGRSADAVGLTAGDRLGVDPPAPSAVRGHRAAPQPPVPAAAVVVIDHGAGDGDRCIRLDRNEIVEEPAPAVVAAVTRELSRLNRYPDPQCRRLRGRLAELHGVETEHVMVGNGIDELLLLVALGLLGPHRVAVVTERTFPGYQTSSALSGATVRPVPLSGYRVDVDAFEAAIQHGADVAFLCNPHNPTGTHLERRELERLVEACERRGCILVCDEAYVEFVEDEHASLTDLLPESRHLVVLRTFSKMMGLAGVRVGYGLGAPLALTGMLQAKTALPFSVNRFAQAAAVTMTEDAGAVARRRAQVGRARSHASRLLRARGIECVPSATNFILVRLPGHCDSGEVTRRLTRECGVLVRDTTPFGFPGHVRVSIGTSDEMEHLANHLATVVDQPSLHGRGARA